MKSVRELHQDAMAAAERGIMAKRGNDSKAAARHFRKAFDLETQAARLAPAGYEPSRSVLFRSAASLALECDKQSEAELLALQGLAGDPSPEIADELREILAGATENRPNDINGTQRASETGSVRKRATGGPLPNVDVAKSTAILKAVSDSDRLQLILKLREGRKSMATLADAIGAEIVNVTHHMGVLRAAGVVKTEKVGRFVYYTLNPDVIQKKGNTLYFQLRGAKIAIS